MPTLKGMEALLFYVQCFLYLVSSLINIFIFYITRLDMFFWIDLIYTMEYSSARRKDEILLFVIIWMDLESIVLGEIS